jgi:2-polyprenyl-6-methoxyphenol hydroxylase-like FAD-dependent oxidoreductase
MPLHGLSDVEMQSASQDHPSHVDVLIVGAGPVGLILALKLGLAGISVLVMEKHKSVLEAPRAITYAPAVNSELKKMGFLDRIKDAAYQCFDGDCWRKPDGTLLLYNDPDVAIEGVKNQGGTLPSFLEKPSDETCVWIIGQDQLSECIFKDIEARCKDHVAIRFNSPCVGIREEKDKVVVMTTNGLSKPNRAGDETLITASWVVGADGAQSAVRQLSCIPFKGHTWTNYRFTAADIEYDFMKECNYQAAAYIVDQENWAVICRTGRDNVYRVCYGEDPSLPDDAASVEERSKTRIPGFIPAANKNYRLRRVKPYYAQQRCAETFRRGRILLAGDAAHVSLPITTYLLYTNNFQANNPIGGLGLTGGILDAVTYGNALVRHIRSGEGQELIDRAAATRRSAWLNSVNPASTENYCRLFSTDKQVSVERDEFFARFKEDPEFALNYFNYPPGLLPDNLEN